MNKKDTAPRLPWESVSIPLHQLCIPHRFSWFQAQAMDAMVNIVPQPPIQLQQAGNKKKLPRPKNIIPKIVQKRSQAALWDIGICNVVWLGDSDSDDGSGRDQERCLLQAIFAVVQFDGRCHYSGMDQKGEYLWYWEPRLEVGELVRAQATPSDQWAPPKLAALVHPLHGDV